MQWFKVVDGGNPDGTAKDRVGLTAGTTYLAKYWNDNFFNIFNALINAGYTLIDDDLSQVTKAFRGGYNSSYVYNTASIVSQSVDDIVLGSNGIYYKCLTNGTTNDNPVGSVTGNWSVYLNPNIATSINSSPSKTTPVDADEFAIADSDAAFGLKKLTWANIKTALTSLFAPVASPALTGTPTAPTATTSTNTTQIATTAFVNSEISHDVGVSNSSLVKTALNASGTAPIYACRAWVNFNGTGTVAITASGNVSSITDRGTGLYSLNLTTPLPDVHIALSGTVNNAGQSASVTTNFDAVTPTVTLIPVKFDRGTSAYDPNFAFIHITR